LKAGKSFGHSFPSQPTDDMPYKEISIGTIWRARWMKSSGAWRTRTHQAATWIVSFAIAEKKFRALSIAFPLQRADKGDGPVDIVSDMTDPAS
jgi:hypothetical protein